MLPKEIKLKFNPKIDSYSKLELYISQALDNNFRLFGKRVPTFTIDLLYSRAELDKAVGLETSEWVVGHTHKNRIYLLSPSVFEKASSHMVSDFLPVLTHEIAHIFTNEFLQILHPIWLYEGIAGYIAEQYHNRKINMIDNFSFLHDSKQWAKNSNYTQSYLFTNFLFKHFGLKKIYDFCKSVPQKIGKYNQAEAFFSYFDQFFEVKFIELVKKWEITVKE